MSYDPESKIRLSEIRVTSPSPATALPAGVTLLGRIPASLYGIAIDTQGNRFATASGQGVGLFDLATGRFSGWIPLAKTADDGGIVWIALAGDRIVCATTSGTVHAVSLTERKTRPVCKIDDIQRFEDLDKSIKLSPDGNFLAWHGIMAGLHIVKVPTEGSSTERLLETPQIWSLTFSPDNKTLQATSGSNRYILQLDDWEKASPQITGDVTNRDRESPSRYFTQGGNSSRSDLNNQILFHVGYEKTMPTELAISSRTVTLPQGLLALDQHGAPFFIDGFGQIFRIETTKLKGFVPVPAKSN
ncbi:MAG: WD40 repeat domain-containing protein [Luteolibacter sp.]